MVAHLLRAACSRESLSCHTRQQAAATLCRRPKQRRPTSCSGASRSHALWTATRTAHRYIIPCIADGPCCSFLLDLSQQLHHWPGSLTPTNTLISRISLPYLQVGLSGDGEWRSADSRAGL